MLKLTLLLLLAAISVSGCVSTYCPVTAFHGCGGPFDPFYLPFTPPIQR
jgi:hypothetical protein